MLTKVHPKLPMRDKALTKAFYVDKLGFRTTTEYDDYLIIEKDNVEIHFFEFKTLDPKENYGQVYIRTDDIDGLYRDLIQRKTEIHPNGPLEDKAWRQREFSVLDPDNNLVTFGQAI